MVRSASGGSGAAKDAVANTVEYARGTMGEQAWQESMTPELPDAEHLFNPYTYTDYTGNADQQRPAE